MKHQIVIRITEPNGRKNILLTGDRLKFPGDFFKLFTAYGRKMLVLVPGDSVESIEIKEVEGGMEHEQYHTKQ